MSDRLTSDRDDPRLNQVGARGLQEAYLVLSEEERAKGFVRPVRETYAHVGRPVCGKPASGAAEEHLSLKHEGKGWFGFVCSRQPGHEGACDSWLAVKTERDLIRLADKGVLGGCDDITTMARGIAETYARDPSFYGATYCARCQAHFPVGEFGEFVWADAAGLPTDARVGT